MKTKTKKSESIRVNTGIKAGGVAVNHNESELAG